MRGELSETSPAALLTALAHARARGRLVIDGPNEGGREGQATVTFRDGVIVDAGAPGPRARLLDRLAVAGRIDEPTATHLRERTDGGRDEAAVLAQAQDAGVDHRLLRRLRTEQVLDAVAACSPAGSGATCWPPLAIPTRSRIRAHRSWRSRRCSTGRADAGTGSTASPHWSPPWRSSRVRSRTRR